MSKALEHKLEAQARKLAARGKLRMKKGESRSKAIDRYVYGSMNKLGFMHGNKRVK